MFNTFIFLLTGLAIGLVGCSGIPDSNLVYKEWYNLAIVPLLSDQGRGATIMSDAVLRPARIFVSLMKKMSVVFRKHQLTLNYVEIGAGDGVNDNLLKLYLQDTNIRGLFIEPLEDNIRDFELKIEHEQANSRTKVIRAAVNESCHSPHLLFDHPPLVNGQDPHWMRRELGYIRNSYTPQRDSSWTTDTVQCVTYDQLLSEWPFKGEMCVDRNNCQQAANAIKPRPHIVQIDAEGSDGGILRSIMSQPPELRPLLIMFEVVSYKMPFVTELAGLLKQAGYLSIDHVFNYKGVYQFNDIIAVLNI